MRRTPALSQGVIGVGTALIAALVPIEVLGELVSIGTLLAGMAHHFHALRQKHAKALPLQLQVRPDFSFG